jgi:hypothetical protein
MVCKLMQIPDIKITIYAMAIAKADCSQGD